MADVVEEEQNSLRNLSVDVQGSKELEVLLAEIENRLRRTVLRIIRPTLDQQVDISSRLETIAIKVDQHESLLDHSDKLTQEVDKQAEIVGVLREQLSLRDEQARNFEKQSVSAIVELRANGADIEVKLEEHGKELQRAHRESIRICDDVGRMQDDHDETVKRIWEGVNSNSKKADNVRDEFATNIAEVHRLHNNLTEELFGDAKGLTKLRSDLAELTKFVSHLPQIEFEVEDLGRKQAQLGLRQDECESFCKKAQASYQDFTSICEGKLSDISEEFRESVNQLVAHHASLMKGVRVDFQHELAAAKSIRDEVTNLETKTHRYCQDIAHDLLNETKRLDSIHVQLTQELDDAKKHRKRERQGNETGFREVKRDMAIQQEVVSSFHGSLAYLSRVLGLVLEGERVTSALHVQDFVDRLGERWLGRPEDSDRRAQAAHTADMLEKMPRRFPGDTDCISGNPSMFKLVPLDPRQGLAKLGYVPGRISYGGSHYDRQDMLLLHSKLLQKAQTAFERGPPKDPALGPIKELASFMSTGQPSAIGGTGGSTRILGRPKKTFGDGSGADDFSEDPKSTAASTGTRQLSTHGSRQRPGSQGHRPGSTGQPQGTGSRGAMFGSLGDTEPPPGDGYRPEGLGSLAVELIGRGSKGSIRLPVIESLGSSTAREQPAATEAIQTGSLRCNTAR